MEGRRTNQPMLNLLANFPMRPPVASEQAADVDNLFFAITALLVFFTMVVVVIIVVLAVKYRKGSKASRKNPMSSHIGLELTWSVIPLLMAIGIFAWSTKGFLKQRAIPDDAMEIFVVGKQWMWHIQHSNGIRENNELTVPVNTPVKLTMISQDVLHSMYLPAFRTQYHVVPGRYTDLWFTATKVGTYNMVCAMHCGTQHSEMVGKVHVLSESDYSEWLASGGDRFKPEVRSMEESGSQLFVSKGCFNCHTSVDNERGPTLKGLIGRQRKFADGGSHIADEQYVRESILEPWERLTFGYRDTMPAYKGQLTEEQVLQLMAFMKSDGAMASVEGDGEKAQFEREDLPNAPGPNSPDNATRIANEKKSASASQFKSTGGGN